MSTLIILLVSFGMTWLLNRYVIKEHFTISLMGRVAMAIMLLFTGVAHFYKTVEMVQMMPDFLPAKKEIVYVTGIFEILAAVGLLFSRTAYLTSLFLIIFFLTILPANIIGAIKQVAIGGMENGPAYLFFRIPLQFLFIWWTYYFGIRRLHRNQIPS